MLKSYLLTAIRNISRHKSFSILNLLGLTTGIISFMIIILYIQHELSFNKHIAGYENKYRVVEIQYPPGIGEQLVAVTMGPLGPTLSNDYPEVVKSLRIKRGYGLTVKYKNQQFVENHFAFADSTVFDMLSVDMIKGDEKKALEEPHSIILSEKLAKKYFGDVSEAMGQVIDVIGSTFTVRGIMENYTKKSSVYFNALIPYKILEEHMPSLKEWHTNSLDTYVQLAPGTDPDEFEKNFQPMLEKYRGGGDRIKMKMFLQPVKDIHLKSNHIKFQTYNYHQGDINQVYIFSAIALLILIVACINYINLSTSMALKRSKEVGVRKVVGADRKKLISQFMGESYTLVILSAIIAIGGISLLLPAVNKILGIDLTMSFSNPVFTMGILLTILFVGLISGFYPALYTSGFKPTIIFRGFRTSKGKSQSNLLRKILVVTQFGVSIVIIISTIITLSQVSYFQTADKGYNDEAVYYIPMPYDNTDQVKNIDLLRKELETSTSIVSTASSSNYNGVAGNQSRITVADTSEKQLMARFGYVDDSYFTLMDIPIKQGRNFDESFSTDQNEAIIINEIAAKKLGWKNPVGKYFQSPYSDSSKVKVVGVIRDYNYYSLRSPIEPAVYLFRPGNFEGVLAKLQTQSLQQGVKDIKSKYNELFPGKPFDGYFVNEIYETQYADEINTTRIFGIFAALCIFISCLGLFGLISFVINQKNKEIAIRKVFGSNVKQVISVISKEFLLLILIASLIGIPVAYYYMNNWLENFAYRISLSWYYFAIAVVVALVIAFGTMIYKILSAARANPANALRDE